LKLNRLAELYPGRVYSKPEFTPLPIQFQRGKSAKEINDWTNAHQLDLWVSVQNGGEDVFEASRAAFKRQAQEWAGLKVDPEAELFVFVGRW
jgi:hypothetical protein